MPKILFILTYCPDPRLINRIRSFLKYGYEVELIFAERTHPLSPFVSENVHKIYKLKYPTGSSLIARLYGLAGFLKKAKEIVRKSNAQIVYTSGFDGLVAANLCARGKGNLVFYEVSDMPGGRWYERKLCRLVINAVEKMLVRRVDKFILTSPYFNQGGKYDKYKSKIEVVFNLPEKRLFVDYEKREHEDFVIGYFGLVRDKKAMMVLVEALGDMEDVKVLIAGRGLGDDYEDIVEACQRCGNIEIRGGFDYEQDIVEMYSSIDCVYSVYDFGNHNVNLAMGNKLYEAIVCGLPVLVARGSKMGDFVESKKIGFAVRHDMPDDIKEAVLKMANDKELVKGIGKRCGELRDGCFYEAAEAKFMAGVEDELQTLSK